MGTAAGEDEVSIVLEVSDLKVKRGKKLTVDVPAFTLHEGEFVSLIGPNGAGKSTFLLALASLIPFSGLIMFRGEKIREHEKELDYRRRISFVFQDPLLLHASVQTNIAMGLKLRRLKQREIDHRVYDIMEKFGITHLAKRNARNLSGGEAQRVSLARALAVSPEIIFLDEPFSSLDTPTREGLRDDFKKIIKEKGTAAIMATHDRQDALVLSDRVGVMNEGKIIQMGAALEVMNRPASEFVASFVGIESIIPGRVVSSAEGIMKISTAWDNAIWAVGNLPVGEKVLCCIRPENVTIMVDGEHKKSSARNLLWGTIAEVSDRGFLCRITVDCGFPITSDITNASCRDMSLHVGKGVYISFKATAVHVIKQVKDHNGKVSLSDY